MFLVIMLTACLYKKSDIPVNRGPWVRVYVVRAILLIMV